MPDLKPCPFCGAEPKFDKISWGQTEEHCVICPGCNIVFTVDWLNPEMDDLADEWNRRTCGENT